MHCIHCVVKWMFWGIARLAHHYCDCVVTAGYCCLAVNVSCIVNSSRCKIFFAANCATAHCQVHLYFLCNRQWDRVLSIRLIDDKLFSSYHSVFFSKHTSTVWISITILQIVGLGWYHIWPILIARDSWYWYYKWHTMIPGLMWFMYVVTEDGREGNFLKTRNTFYETWYLPHSRVHKSMAELCSNFGDSAMTKGLIAYFSLRMRETPIFLLPVINLTSPSCSPTPISYKMKEFSAIRPQVRAKLHIFHCACAKLLYFYFQSKIGHHYRVCRPRFPIGCRNFGDSAIYKGQIGYFSLRMRETPVFLLPDKNLTSPLCSPTPISYKMQEFWRFGHI